MVQNKKKYISLVNGYKYFRGSCYLLAPEDRLQGIITQKVTFHISQALSSRSLLTTTQILIDQIVV
jgi:hypothetical protein